MGEGGAEGHGAAIVAVAAGDVEGERRAERRIARRTASVGGSPEDSHASTAARAASAAVGSGTSTPASLRRVHRLENLEIRELAVQQLHHLGGIGGRHRSRREGGDARARCDASSVPGVKAVTADARTEFQLLGRGIFSEGRRIARRRARAVVAQGRARGRS